MKPSISSELKKKIEHDINTSVIAQFLKHKEHIRFNVGDILIKQTAEYKAGRDKEATWKTHTVSNVSRAPKKYMYLYENEYGMGYAQQINSEGTGFTSNTVCLATIDFKWTRFTLDPEYADHLLLSEEGTEYSIGEQFKLDKIKREETNAYNKKIAFPLNRIGGAVEMYDFFDEKAVIGQTVWIGYGIRHASQNAYKLMSIKAVAHDGDIVYNKFSIEVQETNKQAYKYSLDDNQLFKRLIFFEKPRSYSEQNQ